MAHQTNVTEKPTENAVHEKFYFSNTECCQLLHYMSPHLRLHVPLKEHCFQLHLPRDTKVPVHCFLSFGTTKIPRRSYHIHTPKRSNLEGQCGILKCFAIRKKKMYAYTHTCAPEQCLTEPQLTRVSKPPPKFGTSNHNSHNYCTEHNSGVALTHVGHAIQPCLSFLFKYTQRYMPIITNSTTQEKEGINTYVQ